MSPESGDLANLLLRWGRRAAALSHEADQRGAELESGLLAAETEIQAVVRLLAEAVAQLDPRYEEVRRLEEVAQVAAAAATRTDLLGLNVQVEAARLGEEDRGLEGVGHEIRSLASGTAQRSEEVEQLARSLRRELRAVRGAWTTAEDRLGHVRVLLERAVRATQEAGEALSEARGASAQLSAGMTANLNRQRPWADADSEAATRLAAAAEVRTDSIQRVAQAAASRLAHTRETLEVDAGRAEDVAELVHAFAGHLDALEDLVHSTDEIGRRAKQLAINADLAATNSDDPAFSLFAEEARRLSEQAEGAADSAQGRLGQARATQEPALEACGELAASVRNVVHEVASLLERFAEEERAREGEGKPPSTAVMRRIWRDDRAAARQLDEARAQWRSQEAARALETRLGGAGPAAPEDPEGAAGDGEDAAGGGEG